MIVLCQFLILLFTIPVTFITALSLMEAYINWFHGKPVFYKKQLLGTILSYTGMTLLFLIEIYVLIKVISWL
jgi:hypothetical protein